VSNKLLLVSLQREVKLDLIINNFFVVSCGMCDSLFGIVISLDYLRKIIVQGRSSKSTKVGDIMTEEVCKCTIVRFFFCFCGLKLTGSVNWQLQNKLITVTPETKVLRAMQLMTGKQTT